MFVLNGVSYTWVSIVKAVSILQPGFHFRVGRGSLSVWFDKWYDQWPLAKLVEFVHLQLSNIYINGSLRLLMILVTGVWSCR